MGDRSAHGENTKCNVGMNEICLGRKLPTVSYFVKGMEYSVW